MLYEVTNRKNPQDRDADGKYYARMVYTGEVAVRDLASEISRLCTLTLPDVYAAFEALVQRLPMYLLSGQTVRLGEFGLIRLAIASNGNVSAEDFSAGDITGLRVNFRPGKALMKELDSVTYLRKLPSATL